VGSLFFLHFKNRRALKAEDLLISEINIKSPPPPDNLWVRWLPKKKKLKKKPKKSPYIGLFGDEWKSK
jgi:hypothetical protein